MAHGDTSAVQLVVMNTYGTYQEVVRITTRVAWWDDDDDTWNERNPRYKPWSHFTYQDGPWLAADNERILCDELKKLTGIDEIDPVEDGDPDGEDGYVAFSIHTDYREGETVAEWIDRIGWPVIATLTNATDPGTFNYPYLFSAMLYKDIREGVI